MRLRFSALSSFPQRGFPPWCFGGAFLLAKRIIGSIGHNLGYKLIETSYHSSGNGLIAGGSWAEIQEGATFIFAIPWSASGLEEVATTLKSFVISPNPANIFVDILLDYSLIGESEVVFISEAGYIAHKENINNISKNEKYNIDISKIPAGKYLVTIVNSKTYTTPQKLIIF